MYRLHFELGMPAVRIAEALKVDRNTVNSDLKLLYAEAMNDYNSKNMQLADYVLKQVVRLEAQRDRLGLYLEKAKDDINNKIAIERLIADLDFRLLNVISKLQFGHIEFWDKVAKEMNTQAERKKLDIRFTSIFELYQISVKSRKKLDDLKEEIDRREDVSNS